MSLTHDVVVAICKFLTGIAFRVDAAQLERVPKKGPLILVGNHVHFVEAPVIYPRLQPRPTTALALASRWDKGWSRWMLNLIGAIPIRRGESDVSAIRTALELIKAGRIVFIAPEGTRSGDGRLQQGQPGIVLLALRSGAPLLPMVQYGFENCEENMRRLRRTDFHIAVGKPFRLDARGAKVTHQVRQQMVDEIMYQLAALLPPAYRGVYSDMSAATTEYLDFLPESEG
jgi:1-acyl-sn-glycerol-3-phosphate acyltransferase